MLTVPFSRTFSVGFLVPDDFIPCEAPATTTANPRREEKVDRHLI